MREALGSIQAPKKKRQKQNISPKMMEEGLEVWLKQ
jgi:hypothetical protein